MPQLSFPRWEQKAYRGHYHKDWNFQIVGTGDAISLGRREIKFIEATMLHWPDSMFSYVSPEGVLMPNDAFGQHYATAFRFNDQVNEQELYEEALKYYANILTPYSQQVIRKIDEIMDMKLPLSMIAPSHGVIWRDNPGQIVEHYVQLGRAETPAACSDFILIRCGRATRKNG